jgi:hypothetical protein
MHNPSADTKRYTIKLDRAFGLLPGSGSFHISSPLDDSARDLPATCQFGDALTFELKPHEIRILNFTTQPHDWTELRPQKKR